MSHHESSSSARNLRDREPRPSANQSSANESGPTVKLPSWITNHAKDLIDGARRGSADSVLRAINQTRNTVLATNLGVANQGGSRRRGLLGRDGLAPGEGLWIKPCEAVHTVGMRFAIDLVYLDRKHRVRKLRSNVAPWRLSACLSAHSVIELPAGTIRDTQTQRGDTLEFASATA